MTLKFGDYDVTNWRKFDWLGRPALVPPGDSPCPVAFVFDTDPPRAVPYTAIIPYEGVEIDDTTWNALLTKRGSAQ